MAKIEKIKELTNDKWAFLFEDPQIPLIVSVELIDIFSAGFVYEITVYSLDGGLKWTFHRVKSGENFFSNPDALAKYFTRESLKRASLEDICMFFDRKKLTKKDRLFLQDNGLTNKQKRCD